jgi:sugar lactone lactonase YvrE
MKNMISKPKKISLKLTSVTLLFTISVLLGMVIYQPISFESSNNLTDDNQLEPLSPKANGNATAVSQWGEWGDYDSSFIQPRDMAISSLDWIYVCDTNNHRIQVFDNNGDFLFKWGSYGTTADGAFNYPTSIALSPDGKIYVADTKNHRIQVFNATTGVFIEKWGAFGYSAPSTFNNPQGVAVDADGNVYVSDTYNNRIQKLSSSGSMIGWEYGTVPNTFNNPTDIAISSNGEIYISDTLNDRIQVYNYDSFGFNFVRKWGSTGIDGGQFQEPMGLFVSSSNDVYVADSWNHRIQKFDGWGHYETDLGSYGSNFGQLNRPTSVVEGIRGDLFVLDMNNNRIQKFQLIKNQQMYPTDILETGGYFYYMDNHDCTVYKLYKNGTLFSSFGSRGDKDGQFQNPVAMTSDSESNIYVLDMDTAKIQKFSKDGVYNRSYGGSTLYNNKSLSIPQDIIISSQDHGIYVTDTGNHRILKLFTNGTLAASLGSYGRTLGKLVRPFSIATRISAFSTTIFVLDETGRVQSNGTTWAQVGDYILQKNRPAKLEIDNIVANNKVYITDPFNNRIMVFNMSNGHYITNYAGAFSNSILNSMTVIFDTNRSTLVTVDVANMHIHFVDPVLLNDFYLSNQQNNILTSLSGLAFDGSQTVYIADEIGKCIRKYSIAGDYLGTIGPKFGRPTDIAIDNSGYFLITDVNENAVIILYPNGTYYKNISATLDSPRGIAVNKFGYIFVSDTGNNQIKVYNSKYEYQFSWGKTGSGLREFMSPIGLYIDDQNDIYIADSENNRIQVYSVDGTYKRSWGQHGLSNGRFQTPQYITDNGTGVILVSDLYNHQIQGFTKTGTFVSSWGELGTSAGKFERPKGICFIGNDSIFIVDSGNRRIQVLKQSKIYGFTSPTIAALSLTSTNGNVTIDWDDVYDADDYFIYRSNNFISHITSMDSIANTTESEYLDEGLPSGTYYYVVVAANDEENSTISNCISVTVNLATTTGDDGIGISLGFEFYAAIMIGILIISKRKKRVKKVNP